MKLLVSMGIPAKDIKKREEGFRYVKAVIQIIDWCDKKVIKEINYTSPLENLGGGLSQMFKGAAIHNNYCYVVSNTEVLRYDLSNWELTSLYTDKSFNDLHGVLPTGDGVYVCNTGLEIVQKIESYGEPCAKVVSEINIASQPTWQRFNNKIDYRTIPTTKPHEAHINHLFTIRKKVWVNLGNSRKAICVTDPNLFIDMDSYFDQNEKVLCHDGLVVGDKIYFTSVSGKIIIVDKNYLKVEKIINLNKINNLDKDIGWTRGIEVVGTKAYVGITKVRRSRFKEYTKYLVTGEKSSMPSSIIELDLEREVITDAYEAQNYQGHGIYSIIKLPEQSL